MRKLLTCFFAITMFAPSVYAADGAVSRVIPTGEAAKSGVSGIASRQTVSRQANRDVMSPKTSTENSVRNTVSRVFAGTPDKETAVEKKTISRGGVIARQGASENHQIAGWMRLLILWAAMNAYHRPV